MISDLQDPYWAHLAQYGTPAPAQAAPVSPLIASPGGLRSWEMGQGGLAGAAGGMPYGIGDYAGPAVATPGGDWLASLRGMIPDGFLSTEKQQGWGMPAMGAAQGIFNAWMGMKQYGLAKDQLAEGKRQFGLNYDAQRSTTNAQLEDRQRARLASNPGAYQSVGDYMGTYGIPPRKG